MKSKSPRTSFQSGLRLTACLFTLMTGFFFVSYNAEAGEEDVAYFKQFLYRAEVDDSDPDFPKTTYYFLGSDPFFKVSISGTQDLIVHAFAFLREDGTYKGVYKEFVQEKGSTVFYPHACKEFDGKWSVPDKMLLLEKDGVVWGEGERYFANGQHAVMLTFREALNTSAVKGARSDMSMFQSQQGIDEARCSWF